MGRQVRVTGVQIARSVDWDVDDLGRFERKAGTVVRHEVRFRTAAGDGGRRDSAVIELHWGGLGHLRWGSGSVLWVTHVGLKWVVVCSRWWFMLHRYINFARLKF